MKRYMIAVIIMWLISVLFLFVYSPESDNSYMLEINRLHKDITQGVMDGGDIPSGGTNSIQSIEIADISQLTTEQAQAFFAGGGIDKFIILPAGKTEIFIRYTIKPQKENPLPVLIFLSLPSFIALFVLIKIQLNVLIPLRMMSEIPGQLAKGHLQYNALQYKGKLFHQFLWGLDMLRAKLDEQKDINLSLEKERKTLVASLSHDIKTPLSSIRNYGLAIKDGVYSTQEEVQDALDVMIEKTVKIEKLADQLMASSVNAIEKITVDVSPHYLSELWAAADKTVRNRISLLKMEYHMEALQTNPIVLADMDRLIEVFDNIIENAVKYGDLGSLSVRFSSEGQYTLISFENTGGRIPEAELKHVFSSFYRGSNVGMVQGHGLGLYIARKVMGAMEGDIYAENTCNGVNVVLIIRQAV